MHKYPSSHTVIKTRALGMQNLHYVGVCGVSKPNEAKDVVSLFHGAGFTLQKEPIPMMGFQTSWKSLKFGFSEGNNRVPPFDQLPIILEAVKGEVFPTIHYYTKELENLVPEVIRIMELDRIYESGRVGGLQINIIFPSPKQISEIKARYPELKIILQISPKVSEGATQQVARNLATNYKELDYIILDPSRGTGKEFDPAEITATYLTFRQEGVKSNIVFSGGLNGENVKAKMDLLKKVVRTEGFSIDAEGGLRNKIGEGYGNDVLDLKKVEAYLRGAAEALL